MFGIDSNVLLFVVLAGCSAGAIAYALLFTRISNEQKAEKRLQSVKSADTDRMVVKASRDRLAEAAKRRKSIQESLKELDEKQKGVSYRAAKLYKFDRRKYSKIFQNDLNLDK